MLKLLSMKIKTHKEILFIIGLVLNALAIAMSVAAHAGTSVYVVPSIALASKIKGALPTTWGPIAISILGSQSFADLIIHVIFLIVFCIIIRKFRPFFLLSFVSTFLYACLLYGFQWIPAFWPDVNHNYPLYIQIILLLSSIVLLASGIAILLKTYLYSPVVTFVQKGLIQHFNIKREGLFLLLNDMGFMVISFLSIYALYHDWKFWEHNLSYGSLCTVFLIGPLVGVFSRTFDKIFTTKALSPKWEKIFEIENKKGY